MKKVNVSIITVSFNAEKTIKETIKSVLSQSYKNIEYILVDGASTDDTMKIIDDYKNKISKVISEKDNGLYDAMNKGVVNATGEIIYFLNADDVLKDNNVIATVVKEFEKDFELGFVFGDVEFFYSGGNKKVRVVRNFSLNDLKNGNMPPHQGSFVKKKYLLKYPFSLKYKSSSDFEFYCNLIKEKPKFKKINKVIATMQVGGVSSGKMSYFETEQIVKTYFGNFYYYKLKIKHTLFSKIKIILNLIKISIHKG
jgi:glycosyltransferase involved in cell wall biosynthesis